MRHISASQIDMFYRCGEQWRRRYIEGEKTRPGIALITGSSLHEAAEHNWKVKQKTQEDEQLSVLKDVAAQKYDDILSNDGIFVAPEDLPAVKTIVDDGKDMAVNLVTPFREEFAPNIWPDKVEHKFELEIDGFPNMLGFIDLVGRVIDHDRGTLSKETRLCDIKTAAKKWTQAKADGSNQMTIYWKALQVTEGKAPDVMAFDQFIKSTKNTRYESIQTTRTEEDFIGVMRRVKPMLAAIEAGIFMPAESDGWICSPKWCGFYQSCRYVQAIRNKVIIDQKTKEQ